MQSRAAKLAIGGAVIVVVVIGFIVLQGNNDSSDTDTAGVAIIKVVNGQPVGGVQDLTFTQGGDIRFQVDSDVSDEVHFHGYDVGKDVKAGGSVTFDVPATITGKFEVELENRVTQLAEITVHPS
jgi:hypothetical protein